MNLALTAKKTESIAFCSFSGEKLKPAEHSREALTTATLTPLRCDNRRTGLYVIIAISAKGGIGGQQRPIRYIASIDIS
jgi:hypothetical protein